MSGLVFEMRDRERRKREIRSGWLDSSESYRNAQTQTPSEKKERERVKTNGNVAAVRFRCFAYSKYVYVFIGIYRSLDESIYVNSIQI